MMLRIFLKLFLILCLPFVSLLTAQIYGATCVGNGNDGALVVDMGASVTWDEPRSQVLAVNTSTSLTLDALVAPATKTLSAGDEVLVIQMADSNPSVVGQYEFVRVQSYSAPTLLLTDALAYTYNTSGNSLVQVVRVPNFTNVTVPSGVTLNAPAWRSSGNTGGIIAFRSSGTTTVEGIINANGRGYLGAQSGQGEGYMGPRGTLSEFPNGNGGGQGQTNVTGYGAGGGGGHSAAGAAGAATSGGIPGQGGLAVGIADLTRLTMGGGGGSGLGPQFNCAFAGAGGGIIAIAAEVLEVSGTGRIRSNGANGAGTPGCGGPGPDTISGGVGGGGGGCVALETNTSMTLGSSLVTASGGNGTSGTNGGPKGGNGSAGWIAVRSDGTLTGTTLPAFGTLYTLCPLSLIPPTPTYPPGGTPTPTATPTALSGTACVGLGNEGSLTVSADATWNQPRAAVTSLSSATALVLGATGGTGTFAPGDEVMIIQMADPDAVSVGLFEYAWVDTYAHPNLVITNALSYQYHTGGNAHVQVIRVPNYTTVTVNNGVTLSAPVWSNSNSTGGVIAFRSTGLTKVDGTISANAKGYLGSGGQGEGYTGPAGTSSPLANGNGGGQGQANGHSSGGGGGHALAGESGTSNDGGTPGQGGLSVGIDDLSQLTMGGGGGSGLGPEFNCIGAGSGGGIIAISAGSLTVNGNIQANGGNGYGVGGCGGPGPDDQSGGVGGGAGGSIALQADTSLNLGTNLVTASGGNGTVGTGGGPAGGDGSIGRIAIRGTATGSTSPSYGSLFSLCHGAYKPGPATVSGWRQMQR